MNLEKLIARVKSILLSPRSEWPVIAEEPATVKGLYTGYFMILAAIPAIFAFIKESLIGYGAFGVTVTTPILAGITGMIISYVLSLVLLYVVALVVNALANGFGGQKDQVQALKVVGYAWTAAWVAAIATIVPWLGWLVMVAGGIYSIYLLYLGLPHTMKCPQDKAVVYTVVTVVITVVLGWIMGLLIAGITAMAGVGSAASASMAGSRDANVTFDEDSRLGQLAAWGARMESAAAAAEEAGNRARASADAGDPEAEAKASQEAMGAMMGAMLGGEDGKVPESLSPDQLKLFLPESLDGMERTSVSASRRSGMGIQVSEASASYANDDRSQRIDVSITDMPATGGLMAMASAFAGETESQSEDGYERSYMRDGQRISEKWNNRTGRGEFSIVVAGRFQVEAQGTVDDMDQLKDLVGAMDLDELAGSQVVKQ